MRLKRMSNTIFKGWKDKDMPVGGILTERGNSVDYETGLWSPQRLIWNEHTCIQCLNCWIVCPDSSILTENGKVTGPDIKHCKGCGICVEACPTKPKSLELIAGKFTEID